MVDFNMLGKMGTQIVGAFAQHQVADVQSKMEKSAQAYGNTMRLLSSAQKENNVSQQEANLSDASKRLSASIQRESLKSRSAAEVNAAAAGVSGGSVKAIMTGLRRSNIQAQFARTRNLASNLQHTAAQRRNIQLAAVLGEDVRIIPTPSPATALLGLTATLIDTYDANQPEGT